MGNSRRKEDNLDRDRQVNSLLGRCLDLPENEWEPFLDRACRDSTLIVEVLDLLHQDLGDFLEPPLRSEGGSVSDLGILSMVCLAESALRRGDAERAGSLLEQALKLSEIGPTAYLTRAAVHRALGDIHRIRHRRRGAVLHYERAARLLESADTEAAHQELQRVRFELARAQAPESDKLNPGAESVLDLLG